MYNYLRLLTIFLKKYIEKFLLFLILFAFGSFLIRFLIKYLFDLNIYCSQAEWKESFCVLFSQSGLWTFSVLIIFASFIVFCLSVFYCLLKIGASLRFAIISLPIIAIAIFEAQKYVYAW